MKRASFIVLLFFFLSPNMWGQANIDTLSYDTLTANLQQLSSDKSIVIIGETHDAKNTYLLEFFIIKRLADKGYKDIYLEGGISEATILNMYLKTGDTSLLNHTRAMSPYGVKKLFTDIYDLNKEKNIGFTFHGNDFERIQSLNFLFNKWFSNVSVENKVLKKQIMELLSLKEPRSYNLTKESKTITNAFSTIRNSFPDFENEYKQILKENFPIFKSIIFNPVFHTSGLDTRRDKGMIQLVLADEKQYSLNKVIFICGSYHLITEGMLFPTVMNTINPLYSITAFVPVYKNCELGGCKKPYNSIEKLQKCIEGKQPKEAVITFSLNNNTIIPTSHKKLNTILVEFYNQQSIEPTE